MIRKSMLTLMLASAMLTSLSPISAVILADSSVADAYKTGSDSGVNKLPAVVSRLDTIKDNTIKGVDLTSYQAESSAGVKFYDFNHTELSGLSFMNFLKDNGINYVNLKVAVNPFDDQGHPYGQGVPSINNAIKTATLAKQAGLKVNITLLYSDAYTSDDVQKLPKGWDSDVTKLNQQVKTYTDDVIKHFSDENIDPDMITVGNQINYKFLEKTDWPSITQLIKTITDDISESLPDTNIAIGLGKPNQYWSTSIWQLNNAGIKYDTISANINPAWNSLTDIEAAKQEVLKANKKFTIGSVTYPFTDQDSDGKQNDTLASDVMANGVGTVSPQGQATYIQKLTKLATSDNNNDNAGVFYGDATWIAVHPGNTTNYQANKDASNQFGTGWASQYATGYIDGADQYWGGNTQDNQALFDDQGNPLQSLTVFKQLSDDKNTQVTPDTDDNAAKQDPYEVGGDTGLKDQSVTINKIPSMTNQAIRGVDVSSYQSLKDAGVKFYDYDGKEAPLMKVLHDQGVNYIRIRIWNDPKDANGHYYGGGNNDVEQDLKIAKEANKYGMKLLLDFQYSD
ncbi:glycosyl hydrolase 53 family protein, partial [Weissella cibaria]|uniref:glycosyl hydrolase 53 family protein n=1 Tax=Weissella cibaria TaxID=137591 RepID=UPI0021B01335